MRKSQQATILDLLITLKEAHYELRKQSALETVMCLLSDCQSLAMRIGQYIEGIEGEGTQTVELLEEYCELLYQFSLSDQSSLANKAGLADNAYPSSKSSQVCRSGSLSIQMSTDDTGIVDRICPANESSQPGTPKLADKATNYIKQLQTHLVKMENMVRDELKPNKIEVVFFPYKYAMADSLQSIWEAAMSDPACDVYICPVPYFDRLPGGEMGMMHYEGDLYPKGLPLVDWQIYDVEDRRPDAIFAHAPYDKNNFVTCVHPSFHFEKLHNFTNMLVYIPYFVSGNDELEHFSVLPGTIYADKVYVQSERVRQSYISEFEAWVNQNELNKIYSNFEDSDPEEIILSYLDIFPGITEEEGSVLLIKLILVASLGSGSEDGIYMGLEILEICSEFESMRNMGEIPADLQFLTNNPYWNDCLAFYKLFDPDEFIEERFPEWID